MGAWWSDVDGEMMVDIGCVGWFMLNAWYRCCCWWWCWWWATWCDVDDGDAWWRWRSCSAITSSHVACPVWRVSLLDTWKFNWQKLYICRNIQYFLFQLFYYFTICLDPCGLDIAFWFYHVGWVELI